MKTFTCILFMAIAVFSSEEAALKQIYENRESISVFLQNITFKVGGETFNCNVSGRKEFLSLTQRPFTDWQKNKRDVFEAFFSSCSWIPGYAANDSSFIINNDLYVSILIELLQADYLPALDILNQTSFKLLKRYSNQIKIALGSQPYSGEKKKKYQLLALLDLSEKEKMAIDSVPGLDRAIRARLGNKEQQDSLISAFLKEKDYRKKRNLVSMLSYIGSDTCIKVLIINFNEPLFDFIAVGRQAPFRQCYRESIRYPILLGFRQSFPENPMFHSELHAFDEAELAFIPNDSIKVKSYIERFKTWAKATYNVVPVDADPRPMMLKQGCMEISYKY